MGGSELSAKRAGWGKGAAGGARPSVAAHRPCGPPARPPQEHGSELPLHLDAANAGLVAPLCKPDTVFDFRLKHVVSINVSGHK